jgi:hypothetical protein
MAEILPTLAGGCMGHRTRAMQDAAYGLPRTRLLRAWVNKRQEEGPGLLVASAHIASPGKKRELAEEIAILALLHSLAASYLEDPHLLLLARDGRTLV